MNKTMQRALKHEIEGGMLLVDELETKLTISTGFIQTLSDNSYNAIITRIMGYLVRI